MPTDRARCQGRSSGLAALFDELRRKYIVIDEKVCLYLISVRLSKDKDDTAGPVNY
ncbi:hypothetical protein BDR04DRAFT_1104684 [Suillus decipiens]|nr:hypothetical protein BDR04DRAFT_1104684 [Suillus decipiens]